MQQNEEEAFVVEASMIPSSRPSKESVLKRLAEALLRRSLTKIDLSQRGLQPSDAKLVKMALLQNQNLTSLKLGYNALGDEGTAILAAGLTRHKAIRSIDLGFNNIGDEGCIALAQSLPDTVETLYLAGNHINEEGATAIADLIRRGCRLRKLFMTGNRIGPDGVAGITQAILDSQLLADSPLTEDEKIDSNEQTDMQELYLGGSAIGSAGCRAMARLLASSSRIRVLSLPNCGIRDEDVSGLAASMKANKDNLPLAKLQLSFNQITCKGIETLVNGLWGSQLLKEISLDNNLIDDAGAQQIGAVLSSLTALEILNLSFNRIQSHGVSHLMKAILDSTSLRSVSVSGSTVDSEAAKSIAHVLGCSHTLLSFEMVHCKIETEGMKHVAAGIVSNPSTSLRKFSGFKLGPTLVSLDFPSAMEYWSNGQILHFVRIMWTRFGGSYVHEDEEKSLDPLHFLDEAPSDRSRTWEPPPATVVIEVAQRAFNGLMEEGSDVFLRSQNEIIDRNLFSPLSKDAIIETDDGTSFHADSPSEASSFDSRPLLATIPHKSFVAPPEPIPNKEHVVNDPARKKKIVEWLCQNVKQLKRFEQLPFSSSELWKLHQHYFTPVVNESGGEAVDMSHNSSSLSTSAAIFSYPEVSRGSSKGLGIDGLGGSADHSALVAASEPVLHGPKTESLPMLKRKVSYKFLGDAMTPTYSQQNTRFRSNAAQNSVSSLINTGPTGHSLPPKSKKARRNRSRISFLPRVKEQLDSCLDVCHEKALITMRQLFYVEQAMLNGDILPLDPIASPRTHLSGNCAADAEMIVVDML